MSAIESAIEHLQLAQLEASLSPDLEVRLAMMTRAVDESGIGAYDGRWFWMTASDVWGSQAGPRLPESEYIRFPEGMNFLGRLTTRSYLSDEGIPMDSLLLSFSDPSTHQIALADNAAFRKYTLQIPILSVEYVSERQTWI